VFLPIVEAGDAYTVTETTVEESTDETPPDNVDVDEVLSEETAPHIPPEAIPIVVKISHYDPNLGGTNCAAWYDGGCNSHLANGERWQDYYEEERTIACPMSVPFGSKIYFDYKVYTCRDRGGAIVITWEGYYWIDILAKRTPYKYGELRDAWLYVP
jgi:hypothetical protein